MAADNSYPVLDGIAPSWCDFAAKLATTGGIVVDMKDVKSINTSRSVEVGNQMRGGRKYKRTTGSETSEASMTLYQEGYQKMLRNLKDAAPTRGNQRKLSLVVFNIVVQFTPPNTDEIYERRIMGCRISGDTLNASEGTDANEVEVPLDVMQIVDLIDGEEVTLL